MCVDYDLPIKLGITTFKTFDLGWVSNGQWQAMSQTFLVASHILKFGAHTTQVIPSSEGGLIVCVGN